MIAHDLLLNTLLYAQSCGEKPGALHRDNDDHIEPFNKIMWSMLRDCLESAKAQHLIECHLATNGAIGIRLTEKGEAYLTQNGHTN
jgi:hypothetical protein